VVDHFCKERAEIDCGHRLITIELLMGDCHREYSLTDILKNARNVRVRGARLLEREQAQDELQIVFDAVVHFPHSYDAVTLRPTQPFLVVGVLLSGTGMLSNLVFKVHRPFQHIGLTPAQLDDLGFAYQCFYLERGNRQTQLHRVSLSLVTYRGNRTYGSIGTIHRLNDSVPVLCRRRRSVSRLDEHGVVCIKRGVQLDSYRVNICASDQECRNVAYRHRKIAMRNAFGEIAERRCCGR
jgi:hypothetical protein